MGKAKPDKEAAARLRKAREDAGFRTAADAIRRFGWEEATYRHHENGIRGYDKEWAKEYARAYKVSINRLLGLPEEKQPPYGTGAGELEVMGDAALGVWRDPVVDGTPLPPAKTIAVPETVAKRQGQKRFCVRVADASVDKEFPVGWFVICASLANTSPEPHDFVSGDFVYIERTRRGLKEMSLRRVSFVNGEKMRLATHSTDPKYKHEITYPPTNSSVEKITLLGKVIGRYGDFPS